MNEYKPNSYKYKEEQRENKATEKRQEKRMEKVVAGTVKTRKRGELRRAADNLISEEAQNIKTYLIMDVLIPTIKNTIWDAITNSLDMVLFGGTGRARRPSSGSRGYDKMYRREDRRPSEVKARARFELDDIIFETRGDAESVLDDMFSALEEYKLVRVSDLYDMAGLTQPYTSHNWGWTNLRNVGVKRIRNGYIIELPKPMAID